MTTRKVLAAATLTALPLFAGALQPGPTRATTGDAARTRSVTERPSAPQWAYVTGEGWDGALLGCVLQGGWGTTTCALRAL